MSSHSFSDGSDNRRMFFMRSFAKKQSNAQKRVFLLVVKSMKPILCITVMKFWNTVLIKSSSFQRILLSCGCRTFLSRTQHDADASYCQDSSLEPHCPNEKTSSHVALWLKRHFWTLTVISPTWLFSLWDSKWATWKPQTAGGREDMRGREKKGGKLGNIKRHADRKPETKLF